MAQQTAMTYMYWLNSIVEKENWEFLVKIKFFRAPAIIMCYFPSIGRHAICVEWTELQLILKKFN